MNFFGHINIRIRFLWMYYGILVIWIAILSSGCDQNENSVSDNKIDLTNSGKKGIWELNDKSFTPDTCGVFTQFEIKLPEYISGIYFSNDSRANYPGVCTNSLLPWKFSSDIREALNVRMEKIGNPNATGYMALFQLENGESLVILPLTTDSTMAWLQIKEDGKLMLKVGNLGKNSYAGDIPLVTWSTNCDYYGAWRDAWDIAINHPSLKGNVFNRNDKVYPELFKYLGWCSWEEYKDSISEGILTEAIDKLKKSKVPVRWVLIDDGHLDEKDRQLLSFNPNNKFPNGWETITSLKDDKIRWIGLWLNMNGWWGRISPVNTFNKKMKSNLMLLENEDVNYGKKYMIPKNSKESAKYYYDKLIETYSLQGFDFVKVDNQSSNITSYSTTSNPVQAAVYCRKALEQATEDKNTPLLNCMAHGPVALFTTNSSNVTRASRDYRKGVLPTLKSHIFQSYHLSSILGQSVWPDHDMFHSDDPKVGQMLAISKAMSGAPVYLSDNPDKINLEFTIPLIYSDGLLIRPEAPAIPLPQSAYTDPVNEPVPYLVVAPLENQSASVVAYNIFKSDTVLNATVLVDDYLHASAMLQPYPGHWENGNDKILMYDWSQQEVITDSIYQFKLPHVSDRLVHLCPVKNGFAVIGRTDKYLSPATVKDIVSQKNKLTFTLKESGPFAIWLEKGIPVSDMVEFKNVGNGLYTGDLQLGIKNLKIEIDRKI